MPLRILKELIADAADGFYQFQGGVVAVEAGTGGLALVNRPAVLAWNMPSVAFSKMWRYFYSASRSALSMSSRVTMLSPFITAGEICQACGRHQDLQLSGKVNRP